MHRQSLRTTTWARGIIYSTMLSLCMTVHCFGQSPAEQRDDSLVPGVVIDYSPASSGCYIGSPSLAILPNGDYVASHDFFGPESHYEVQGHTFVFTSGDRGKTWRQIAEITPLCWAKLFVHNGALYILGTSKEYGDILIRRSDDGGQSWTQPATAATGLLRAGTYHCAPCQTLVHNGRLWRSFEHFLTDGHGGPYKSMTMSAPVEADLLDAANWTFSEPMADHPIFSWLEGAVLTDRQGNVVNVLRTNGAGKDKAAIVHVSPDGCQQSFDLASDLIDLPGGCAKFTVRFDPVSSLYWLVSNQQTNPEAFRNRLVLASSPDLRRWTPQRTLLFHADAAKHAWQYADWDFDGDDIVFASRTAYDDGQGGAPAAHDANYLTFHRLRNFRQQTDAGLEE